VNIQPSTFDLKVVSATRINFIQFACKASKEIKRTKVAPSILVVADPWESYWTARLTRFLAGLKCPIQVQLHGDFGNPVWRSLNFRNRLRFYGIGYALRKSESIRTVSEFQTELIVESFNIKRNKIHVCPPPLNSSYLNQKKNSRRREKKEVTIAFIGRLHSERGIKNLKEIVSKLKKEEFNFKLMVLGGGPEENEMKRELSKVLTSAQVKFHSFLEPRDMASFWTQIDLILSLAPSESYGRAMREALLFGIPVLAIESSGVKDLIQLVGEESVLTVTPEAASAEIVVKIEKLLTARVSYDTKNKIMEVEQRKNSLLIESWAQTMEQFKTKESR
jgi:glycosyltransferase involved in cell wall biosynthesis